MALDLKQTIVTVKGLIIFGWIIAAIRLVLDLSAPDMSMYFGVYYAMPLAYLYYGLTGKMDDLPWSRLAIAMVVVGFFVWFIPNTITYTAAQFMGWDFGRFSAEIQDSTIGKILSGLSISGVTFVAGAGWSVVFGSLLIYLPRRFRKQNPHAA